MDFPVGERLDPGAVDGVVLTGSTAGVYERSDRPWIDDQRRLVEELVEREIPTLGVCFGHQVVNDALGGSVENVGTTARLVAAEFEDDPLFDGVSPVVPAVHGDAVTAVGDGMEVIASADYYPAFATRHRNAPLWTVQFHPEFTAGLRGRLEADFGWTDSDLRFEDANATRVFENFGSIVEDSTA
nr:type 1 glutamine amidotransferase [Halopelagius inordinatus]